MTGAAERFSFSRVTTFEQCARRYRYRYVDGVKEGFQSVEAFMGQQVHATVEWLFQERIGGREPTAERSVERYCATWDREIARSRAPVRVVKNGTPVESYRRTGAELVHDFHRSRFAGDRLETVATERHFAIELDGQLRFQGFIDRLARDAAGRLHIIDYKTGSRVPARFEGKDADQLEAYAVAMFLLTEVEEVTLVLEYLRTSRVHEKRLARGDARAVAERLGARIRAATAATVFPPNPGRLCDWCGFNDLCDAFAGARPAAWSS